MLIRRCAVLFLEMREDVQFDLGSLLSGGAGKRRTRRCMALAPHLDADVEVNADEREVLSGFSSIEWAEVAPRQIEPNLERLLHVGLLVARNGEFADHEFRDEQVRAGHWWGLAQLFGRRGRWQGVERAGGRDDELVTAEGLQRRFGPPPAHSAERAGQQPRLPLPRADRNAFDALLTRRATCRNFDARPLSLDLFARMLERVFSAQAQVRLDGGAVFLKKTSPSGGGLHATEAYLVVQNVDGIERGLYHYHPVDHALEPLPPPALPLDEFARLALAGQHWFANAPVLVVLTPRFARSFWKYRHHAKAYRALILDSGHLSQTLYLSATELGLGAFVTSAINEVDIEQAFGLDPLQESPLAICGFGWRAERMETTEFDPAGEVWEQVADS